MASKNAIDQSQQIIAEAIFRDSVGIFFIDLLKDTYITIKASPFLDQFVPSSGSYVDLY